MRVRGGVVTCNMGNLAPAGNIGVTINTPPTASARRASPPASRRPETDPMAQQHHGPLTVSVSGGTVVVINMSDSGAGSLRRP